MIIFAIQLHLYQTYMHLVFISIVSFIIFKLSSVLEILLFPSNVYYYIIIHKNLRTWVWRANACKSMQYIEFGFVDKLQAQITVRISHPCEISGPP